MTNNYVFQKNNTALFLLEGNKMRYTLDVKEYNPEDSSTYVELSEVTQDPKSLWELCEDLMNNLGSSVVMDMAAEKLLASGNYELITNNNNYEYNLTKEQQELLDVKRQELYKEVRKVAAKFKKLASADSRRPAYLSKPIYTDWYASIPPITYNDIEGLEEAINGNVEADFIKMLESRTPNWFDFLPLKKNKHFKILKRWEELHEQMLLHGSVALLTRERFMGRTLIYIPDANAAQEALMTDFKQKNAQLQFIKNMKTLGIIKND
jgi:hypothetical protein